ncbi:hypothetical protein [Pseudomonas aeruginosa]|uniref:hypothetical protein n=1 Tax=Pseudomonas aeruginosa TaxID=287 RepID=UPI001D0232CE|nr:hypothetical protein [Pseudomonas aeruginosa]
MSAIKLGLSALKGPVSPLPPAGFAAIHPTTTVEEALSAATALTSSVSSILGALTTSDEERVDMDALKLCSRLAGELVDAALDALRKEGQQ